MGKMFSQTNYRGENHVAVQARKPLQKRKRRKTSLTKQMQCLEFFEK
jgi:hypothetical protein